MTTSISTANKWYAHLPTNNATSMYTSGFSQNCNNDNLASRQFYQYVFPVNASLYRAIRFLPPHYQVRVTIDFLTLCESRWDTNDQVIFRIYTTYLNKSNPVFTQSDSIDSLTKRDFCPKTSPLNCPSDQEIDLTVQDTFLHTGEEPIDIRITTSMSNYSNKWIAIQRFKAEYWSCHSSCEYCSGPNQADCYVYLTKTPIE